MRNTVEVAQHFVAWQTRRDNSCRESIIFRSHTSNFPYSRSESALKPNSCSVKPIASGNRQSSEILFHEAREFPPKRHFAGDGGLTWRSFQVSFFATSAERLSHASNIAPVTFSNFQSHFRIYYIILYSLVKDKLSAISEKPYNSFEAYHVFSRRKNYLMCVRREREGRIYTIKKCFVSF